MSENVTKYVSYKSLQQQRLMLAALVLGLMAVTVGILLEVYYRGARGSQISPEVRLLAEPLNPVLNVDVLSQLDTYDQLSLPDVKAQFVNGPSFPFSLKEANAASGSAQTDLVQDTLLENTLSEEEILSEDVLKTLLDGPQDTATNEAGVNESR